MPSSDVFIHPSKHEGLLPRILKDLIIACKRAKMDLKKETDLFKHAVLDGCQLMLKIIIWFHRSM